jgi:hypothetical protein
MITKYLLLKPICVNCRNGFLFGEIILYKQTDMLLYDTNCLYFNEAIIDTANVKLALYTHETGALVLAANLKKQPGKVFFTTSDIYLNHFITNKICLQLLFEAIASDIVTVVEQDEVKLYMRSNTDIQLAEGEKLFSEFKNRNIEYAFPMQKLIAR